MTAIASPGENVLTALSMRHVSDCGQDSNTRHSGVDVSGGISERPVWTPLTQPRAQAQNSLVLEAVDVSIEDLIVPLDGFDLVVGCASESADDVCATDKGPHSPACNWQSQGGTGSSW